MLERLLDTLSALPLVPTYLVLMVLSALENVFPPVPADTAVALGAFLARRGQISVVPLVVLCWLANLASATATYLVARRHGPAFFREGWGRKLMSPAVLAGVEEAYVRWGTAGIFLSRFLPGLRAAVTPFAGVARLGPWRALVPAALASALWYAFLGWAGYAVAENWQAVKEVVAGTNRVLGAVAAVLAVAVLLWLWRRSRRGTSLNPGDAARRR
ncbi:MAG TPA: DedA family protein [Vicinamibacteria bacterium]|nr:DedA family protein [Vicinamibacteria bacterium]